MIWHPLSLSLLVIDCVSLYFLFCAAFTSGRIFLHWSPGSPSQQQILLESAAETASIQGRICLVLQILSFVFLIWGIASLFPQLVPGAMCGTGVLQASGETGLRMLLLRAAALLVLSVWYQLNKSNHLIPEGSLSPAVARGMLVAVPFVLMAMALTAKMLYQLNVEQAVECCAVVYDQFRSPDDARQMLGVNRNLWLLGLGGLSILLFALALLTLLRRKVTVFQATSMAWTGLLWCIAATVVLVTVFSSYHYEVLHHHCPWCLFLPEHKGIGYPLFFAVFLVLLEGIHLVVVSRSVRLFPALSPSAGSRVCWAALRMLGGMGLYFLLAVVPALAWRIRHGVWIG